MTTEEIWQQYATAYGHDSLEAFQRFFGLVATGLLDEVTEETLANAAGMRRCGLRDNLVIISEAKWHKRELTWYWKTYLPGIPQNLQDECTEESWWVWSEVCDLRFKKADSIARADIVYDVGRGRQSGFDGPGGVLAWMQLGTNNDNPIGGMFDLDEAWRLTRQQPGWLLPVQAHENGHALNLNHAPQNSGALMAPYVNWRVWQPQRHDVAAIQSLYGPPRPVEPPPPTGEEGWADKVHKDLFGRAPTPSELGHFLTQAAADRQAAVAGLMGHEDWFRQLVSGWYRKYLHREPDPGGLSNFVHALRNNYGYDRALAFILASAEYRGSTQQLGMDPQQPESPPDGGFMNQLFRTILIQLVTVIVRGIPVLGRFITAEMIERIVDAFLRGLGPQATAVEEALQNAVQQQRRAALTQPADASALEAEVATALGELPSELK